MGQRIDPMRFYFIFRLDKLDKSGYSVLIE